MQAYLISSGFGTIISDKDFPIADRTSKWGAHDEKVFARALVDMKARSAGDGMKVRHFTVVQTSSSHEPFEVPYDNPRFAGEPRKNAFAYTDSCLMAFVDSLRRLPTWDRTLIVAVPDHYGCWPENIPSALGRHHIPLVFAGGALVPKGERIDKPASQTDLGATLLAMMGIPADTLCYSRNIFDDAVPPVAVFTEPSLIGMVTPSDTLVYNPDACAVVYEGGDAVASGRRNPLVYSSRAFLRDLYHTLSEL